MNAAYYATARGDRLLDSLIDLKWHWDSGLQDCRASVIPTMASTEVAEDFISKFLRIYRVRAHRKNAVC